MSLSSVVVRKLDNGFLVLGMDGDESLRLLASKDAVGVCKHVTELCSQLATPSELLPPELPSPEDKPEDDL